MLISCHSGLFQEVHLASTLTMARHTAGAIIRNSILPLLLPKRRKFLVLGLVGLVFVMMFRHHSGTSKTLRFDPQPKVDVALLNREPHDGNNDVEDAGLRHDQVQDGKMDKAFMQNDNSDLMNKKRDKAKNVKLEKVKQLEDIENANKEKLEEHRQIPVPIDQEDNLKIYGEKQSGVKVESQQGNNLKLIDLEKENKPGIAQDEHVKQIPLPIDQVKARFRNGGSNTLLPNPQVQVVNGEHAAEEGVQGDEGHQVEDHQNEGHQVEGHQAEGHQAEGHQDEGHQAEGHQAEGHQAEGHQAEGHQVLGHQGEGHQVEGHQAEAHQVEGHQDEGHQVEGHQGEGHQGEGHPGEGHQGEGHQVEGHQGESHQVLGHQGEGHQVEGHQAEAHQVEGHQDEGHQVEGHQGEGHPGEGHQGEGHQVEGHQGESHQGEGHQDEGHQGEGHQGEGHQGEGHEGEGHPDEGHKGEGTQGEGHKGEGHQGEGVNEGVQPKDGHQQQIPLPGEVDKKKLYENYGENSEKLAKPEGNTQSIEKLSVDLEEKGDLDGAQQRKRGADYVEEGVNLQDIPSIVVKDQNTKLSLDDQNNTVQVNDQIDQDSMGKVQERVQPEAKVNIQSDSKQVDSKQVDSKQVDINPNQVPSQANGKYPGVNPKDIWIPQQRVVKDPRIVNPHNFNYIINNETLCDTPSGHLEYVVYIHMAPVSVDRRQKLRETWAQADLFKDYPSRLIFFMGDPLNSTIQAIVNSESKQYGDIIQEDFKDHYNNLTYKAIGALKWISQYCSHARYIIKADDDVYVNMFLLLDELHSLISPTTTDTMYCAVWQDGTMGILRDPKVCKKWCIHLEHKELKGKRAYPTYCSGSAFFFTPDLAFKLYNASLYTPYFYIDDVYLTGLLPQKVPGFRFIDANPDRWVLWGDHIETLFKDPKSQRSVMLTHQKDIRIMWYDHLQRLNATHVDLIGQGKLNRILSRNPFKGVDRT